MTTYKDIEEFKKAILNNIAEHQGTKASPLATRLNSSLERVRYMLNVMVKEKSIQVQGKPQSYRYYTVDYDRSTHADEETKIAEVQERKLRKKAKQSSSTDIKDAMRRPDAIPSSPSIPADIKSYTPIAELDTDLLAVTPTDDTASEPVTMIDPNIITSSKAKDKVKPVFNPSPKSEIGKAQSAPAPAEPKPTEPKPAPATDEPEPAVAPVPTPVEDIDALFAQLDSLRAIPRGGPFDTQLDTMVAEADARIRSSLRECPHCGARTNTLVTSDKGEHSIRCTCGAMFAYAKDTSALKCTIKAYNKRAKPTL